MASKRESASSSRSSTEARPSLVRIGRVGRPHGTAGTFAVAGATERAELLAPGREVLVGGRRRKIAARSGTEQRPLLRLDGVDGRDAAAALVGEDIEVERGALGALSDGEHLVDDLIGLDVSDGGVRIGRVRDVLVLPSVECLEVERAEGGSLLVPLVGDAVRAIDVPQGAIDVDLRFVEGTGFEGTEESGSDAD